MKTIKDGIIEKTLQSIKNERKMLINLTPHDIVVFDLSASKEIMRIKSQGTPARVQETSERIYCSEFPNEEIPVVSKSYSLIINLPQTQRKGILYIVSIVVLNALKEMGIKRTDILCPDTGDDSVVRDSSGKILGVRRFQC